MKLCLAKVCKTIIDSNNSKANLKKTSSLPFLSNNPINGTRILVLKRKSLPTVGRGTTIVVEGACVNLLCINRQ